MDVPPERPGIPASADLLAWRAGLDAAVVGGMFRTDPAPQEVMLGGVSALRFDPPGAPRATVLHVHGGGFRLGCPEQVAPFAAALAQRAGVTVICPRYRLAPEHPFPAGLNDARAALRSLQQGGSGRIVLSGDSAGGGIAAGLAAVAATDTIAPIGLILLSPWLDLTLRNPSFDTNAASDPLFSRASATAARALYLQDIAPTHPLASPGLGAVSAFPPTFLNVGDGEVLADDSTAFQARLLAVGRAAELHVVRGMEHVAVTRGATLAGSTETLSAIAGFFGRLLRD